MTVTAKTRPLEVRPGARYACAGDGLCCTDIHAVGPLDAAEQQTLRTLDERLVVHRPDSDDHVLLPGPEGRCMFLSEQGCALHIQLGEGAKPDACSRFPLRLTATPQGGRVSASHSCPCRSVGERPALTAQDAEPSLTDAHGELHAEMRVEAPIALDATTHVSFDEYVEWERSLLERLLSGDEPLEQVLDAAPFEPPTAGSYAEVAQTLAASSASNRYAVAGHWFARALSLACGSTDTQLDWPPRPWADAFERSAARVKSPRSAREVYADWLADQLWSLHWTTRGDARAARQELSSLLAVADCIEQALRERGQAPELAAAEAVMIVELASESDGWRALWDGAARAE